MSDLFDALPGGAPRAGVAETMSWEEFWSRVARAALTDEVDGIGERADEEHVAEWVAPGFASLSPRRKPADDNDEEDEDDDDEDDDDEVGPAPATAAEHPTPEPSTDASERD